MATFQVCDQDITEALLESYLADPYLAVDTETMGLVLGRDRLCVVQLCNSAGDVAVVRLARGTTAAPYLKQLLEAISIEKIFHFARFDLAMLDVQLDIHVTPVFCTKIASKLARTYTNRHGLKEVVQELCGVELNKASQSSDWGAVADLSDAQLEYAANDVRYLIAARHRLVTMLQREERWDLAQRCFAHLPTVVELDRWGYEGIFEHH